ncbi:MAG: LysM peptidoglycan-binding domain-containing protein [Aquihabitans sp.]
MTAPSRFRALAAFTVVVLTILVLHQLGAGPLALPPQWSSPALSDWARDRDPVTIALVVFRVLVLAVAYHLAVTTAIGIAGRIMHLPSWVAAAEAWTLPPLRTTWSRLAGLGLTATAALSSQLPAATAATHPPATVRVVEAPPGAHPRGRATLHPVDSEPSSGAATMLLVDETAETSSTGGIPADDTPAPVELEPDVPNATVHLVQPGDHLWAIAETHLANHLGRPATDAEVAPYWRQLIAANPQVANPDLIYPGQSIHVPPIPNG